MSKIVNIQITEEDLQHDAFDGHDCPGFRATKRVIPGVSLFGFYYFQIGELIIKLPPQAAHKLLQHGWFQSEYKYGMDIGQETLPFDFQVEVPDEVEVITT